MSRSNLVKKSNDMWEQAINFAKKELESALARADELRGILRNFEDAKKKGTAWPGNAGTDAESAPAKS